MTEGQKAQAHTLIQDRHRFMVFPSQIAAIAYLNADIVQKARAHQVQGRRYIFTGAGGQTPKPLYAALSQEPIDWSLIDFIILDERFVPLSDERSNEGMILKFFAPTPAHKVRMFGLVPDLADLETSALRAEARLDHSDIEGVDFALIGMGNDGHFASLFPNHPLTEEAFETKRRVLAIQSTGTDQEPVIDRISLSAHFLLKCHNLVIYITGQAKRDAFDFFSVQSDPNISPIGALLARAHHPVRIVWAP